MATKLREQWLADSPDSARSGTFEDACSAIGHMGVLLVNDFRNDRAGYIEFRTLVEYPFLPVSLPKRKTLLETLGAAQVAEVFEGHGISPLDAR